MNRILITIVLGVHCTICDGQDRVKTIVEKLKHINGTEDAELFVAEAKYNVRLLKIDSDIETNEGYSYLLDHRPGDIISMGESEEKISEIVKLVHVDSIQLFRVQYIFFDNVKLPVEKIEKLRAEVLSRLAKGESFEKLASEYSMDGNAKKGGDLGWFPAGQMIGSFENEIRKHSLGEVYKVDIPDNKWYYIVRNSHEPREKRVATALLVSID